MHQAKYDPEAFNDEMDQRIADAEMEADYAASPSRPRSCKDAALDLAEAEHDAWQREQRRAIPQY